MNCSIAECYSVGWPVDRQRKISHRYILGVYDLYERLTTKFPQVPYKSESCVLERVRFFRDRIETLLKRRG